jgi:hypothetical protein
LPIPSRRLIAVVGDHVTWGIVFFDPTFAGLPLYLVDFTLGATLARMTMTEKDLRYLTGFGNEHATEALPGALPEGQNAPQRPPLGLYTEQISGTPFTAPRA